MAAHLALSSIEVRSAASDAIAYISDPSNLPFWAPGFAPTIERVGSGDWRVIRDGQRIRVRPVASLEFGVVDFVRETATGAPAGAFMRIIGQSADRCIVVMSVIVAETADLAKAQTILERELSNLREILEQKCR